MIATAGGTFDRDQRGLYFAAAVSSKVAPEYYLMAVNDLYSDTNLEVLMHHLDAGCKVLLDSGVFNLTNDHKRAVGCSMDQALRIAPEEMAGFDKLYDRYVFLCREYGEKLWGYIELDQGGDVNKRRTRGRLHEEGLSPIPVYHPLIDDWSYFDELAEQYDRICFGNVVQANLSTRVRLLHTLWERHRRYPDLWVHVLGLTANEWCLPCPPDSCDSSSWVNGMRYPGLDLGYTHMRRTGKIWSSQFRYDRGRDDEDREDHYTRALRMYADEVEFHNTLWREIRADVDATFGPVEAMPPVDEAEGMRL